MAHFAVVRDGQVVQLIAVDNDALDPQDEEGSGQAFLAGLGLGEASEFVQTSYNATMRGKYAAIGDLWDGVEFTSPSAPPA